MNAKILFVGSVTTWQAYNSWGGKSLYGGPNGFEDRAREVSFNRPPRCWEFFTWEEYFVKWFYKAKIDNRLPSNMEMEFCSSIDLHENPDLINNYKLVLSIGNDEYWSWEMRDTIQNFISAGGNVSFFSGNVSWWQVRFKEDNEGNPNRIMICYKDFDEDHNANPDVPLNHITINWVEKIINRPENIMTGASYYNETALWGYSYSTEFKVRLQKHWLLKDTGLEFGSTFGADLFSYTFYPNTGFETDAADFADIDHKFPIPTGKLANDSDDFTAPKDLMILATADLTRMGDGRQGAFDWWCGNTFHNGWATMGIFRKRNGGFVFHGGNYNWAKAGLQPYLTNNNWNEFCKITKNILETLSVDFEAQGFLLENPDFESGQLTGWTTSEGGGTASIDAPGYQSNYCAFINASGGDTFLYQQYIPVRTRRNYRIKCFAKAGSLLEGPGGGAAISIRLETIDQFIKPKQEFITASYPTGNDGWLEISAQGSLSTTEQEDLMIQARIKLYVKSGYSAYFDDVVVEEL